MLFSFPLFLVLQLPFPKNIIHNIALIFHLFLQIYHGFYWPLPNNHRISSYFGYRVSPTSGASSYHQGIDIPATENTYFLSIMDCEVIYTGFKGSGGYSIICTNGAYTISYCHVSPNFLVSAGNLVVAGQVIGQVGPKYVYDVIRQSLS